MQQYAKYVNPHKVEFPTSDEFIGVPNWRAHFTLLRRHNYLPLVGTPEDRPGFEAVPVEFMLFPDDRIDIVRWDYRAVPDPGPEPEPVKLYSKYLLKNACVKRGLWDEVKAMIEGAGKWESFLLIQNIASDNEELVEVLPAIREHFGDEVVDEVLAESEEQ